MKRMSIIAIALLPLSGFSQSKDSAAANLEFTAAAHVAVLFKQFGDLLQPIPIEQQWKEACAKNCAAAEPGVREGNTRAEFQRDNAMNAVVAQIHSEIDGYIGRAVPPRHVNPTVLEHSLKRILGEATDKSPSVSVIDRDGSPSLIVVYPLYKGTLMGPGATSVVARAYTVKQNAFRLTAVTGDDMDGYGGLSVVKLHSPVPHELWLLVSGGFTGANGPNIRMRLYAYGQGKFRMVWAPENAWGAFHVRPTDLGFTIDGDYYRETIQRHDAYNLSDDGVYRVPPRRLGQPVTKR